MSWLITLGISLLLHSVFVLLLSLNPWPTLMKVRPAAYTVTLMPVSIPVPEIPPPAAPPVPKEEKIKPVEKIKPIQKPKKDDIVEKVKKKERDKESIDRLHDAIEEIRRKAALDEIHKRVSKREVTPTPTPSPSPSPVISPVPSPTAPSPTPFSVSAQQSKLNEYYSLIWAKIKASWTIPEHLLKERVDLETIIVIIIEVNGKVQKSWFEKKSGNALYDQMAMRAIIKAEPLPPIPKELNQESLEIGIRFTPD
ncbi:MAG: TonB C-terminal domain-containing protein [Deltaproteobacteria bacterium]|nr:TonB C-terminal domain-containing protein [Deltaproteobacteria bacterium]MBM4349382.1 TonB C-terminal domain-containing protein [Deltaproteobacteria bacterium]